MKRGERGGAARSEAQAASGGQKMAENKITNHKIQITNKSQTTNYKSQT